MARPSKLTPEVQTQISQLIRAGNTVEVAAAAAGIGEGTFYEWMARGDKPGAAHDSFREFRAAIEQARAESEAGMVARIAKAASNGSWQAAAWLLERRAPERWAKAAERRLLADQESADKQQVAPDPFSEADELAARRAGRAAV